MSSQDAARESASSRSTPANARDEPLSIRQIEVFVALMDEGSFTRAARSLGLSQPTVSGHMADLERRLDLRLIDRNRSGLRPTKEGEALIRAARETLKHERNLRSGAADLRGLVAGRVVVGASSIPSIHILPERLARFRTRHPDVHLDLRSGSSGAILAGLADGSIDIGVVGAQPPTSRRHPPLQSTLLVEDALVLICSPDHELATMDSLPCSRVLEETLILRSSGSASRAAMLTALDLEDADVSRHDTIEVDTNEAAVAAVRAGLGVSMVSRLSVRADLDGGRLRTPGLDRRSDALERSFWLVRPPTDQLSPASRMLEKVLAEG